MSVHTYARMGWLHREKIMEQVGREHEQVDVPFWRVTKVLLEVVAARGC
jgi:hypothetical protein